MSKWAKKFVYIHVGTIKKLVSDHQIPIDNLHRVNVDDLFYPSLKHCALDNL